MNALDNLNDLILYDFTDVLDRMHLPFPLIIATLDNLNDLILYDFTDVLDRMHLPFPLTTRYLHPEVSHKNK